jgi:putative transposase
MSDKNWVSARTCVFNIGYHIVWSTKYRRKVLTGDIETRCKEMFLKIAAEHNFKISAMEIMPDHVHLFISAHPKYAPSEIVKKLKGQTGRWLFMEFPDLSKKLWKGHIWTESTYYGTVGDVSREAVERYIAMQKEHE